MAAYAGPSIAARNGAPVASVSTVDRDAPRARCAQVLDRARPAPPRGVVPGGMRRFSRAAARGTMAAAEPTTGGQSMPSTVSGGPGPEHVGDGAVAEQLRRRRGRRRRCGTGRAGRGRRPGLGVVEPGDRGVARARRAAWRASRSGRPARPGPAPPNMPECISEASASTLTTTLTMPRRLTVTAGMPTAALPVSQTRIASARSRSAFCGTKSSRPAGALLLRALDDELEVDRARRRRGPAGRSGASGCCPCSRRRRGRTSGRRPRSARTAVCARPPRRAAAGRRSARTAARSARPGSRTARRPDHGLAAVGGLRAGAASANPTAAKRVEHPLGGPLALLRRELARVGDRRDARRARRARRGPAASGRRSRVARSSRAHGSAPATLSSSLRSSTNSWKSASSSGQ